VNNNLVVVVFFIFLIFMECYLKTRERDTLCFKCLTRNVRKYC